MFETAYYFSERQYVQSDVKDHKERLEYWKSLLGENVCEQLQKNCEGFENYLNASEYKVEKHKIDMELFSYLLNGSYEYILCEDALREITFLNFYKPILAFATTKLQTQVQHLYNWFEDSIYKCFEMNCVQQLQKMCMRTLIVKLHECKDQGELLGANPSEEYEYFNDQISRDPGFITTLFREFSVLYRCVAEMIEAMVTCYVEVLTFYKTDFGQIKEVLSLKEGAQKITAIYAGMGDGHNHGRQVLRLQLECGTTIIYKPHRMENEKVYDVLMQWLEVQTEIKQRYYPYVSFENHSWCGLVKRETCKTTKELESYYERFGAHLFLTWLLGTKDLHFENLIAAGAYPVIVDLEMLLSNGGSGADRTTVSEEVLFELSSNVLMSGLLPYYHWNGEGEGIDGSALCASEGQLYPFEIPGIINDKTSDMRIGYYRPRTAVANNLATVNGVFHSPKRYESQIVSGFMKAYRAVNENKKEFIEISDVLRFVTNRYLVADTQRYSMLLNSSYHPSLLVDAVEREMFLYAIWQGREDKDKSYVETEVQCMLRGDIPLFYNSADNRDLCADGRVVEAHFFERSAYENFLLRVNHLTLPQIQKQCDCISTSLRMIKDDTASFRNNVYFVEGNDICPEKGDYIKTKCDILLKRILDYAVWNKERSQVNWSTVYISEQTDVTWYLTPMNMYLYDGLAGMLLILAKAEQIGCFSQVKEYVNALRQMFFAYTEVGLKNEKSLHTTMTGTYEGEGSILYMYMLLYKMTEDDIYLSYAKKHAQIVGTLLERDKKYDLLSGNAGAAQMLLWVYQITGEEKYLHLAEYAIDLLSEASVKQKSGIGWKVDGSEHAMSGMAHGNAGILMPVIWLWSLTGNTKYDKMAEEIWRYENSLYNMLSGNWDDYYMEEQMETEVGAVSWCHGSPGILLSRIFCYGLVNDEEWKQRFWTEMHIAYKKLKNYWQRDSWCLCHGNCGNLWILELAESFFEKEGIIVQKENFVTARMKNICLQKEIRYLPQEILNPGLLNGYGGSLLYFLHVMETEKQK